MEGGGSHFSPLAATSVLTAHISWESRGLLGQGLHDAGYFHPDVLCHHRPGHPVLHYLSALVACSCGGSPEKNSSGGRMKLTWPNILLADAPVDFCYWSLSRLLVSSPTRGLLSTAAVLPPSRPLPEPSGYG